MTAQTFRLSVPLTIKRRGSEVRLVLENGEPSRAKVISSLTKAVSAGVSKIHARRMLLCAALSSALTERILEGRQPVDLTFDKLTRNLPLSWERQSLSYRYLPLPILRAYTAPSTECREPIKK